MQTDLTKLDTDLTALVPSGATPVEKLYAQAIDDRRTMFTEAMPVEKQKADAATQHSGAAVKSAEAVTQQAAATQKFVDEMVAQAKQLLSGPNELFVSCAMRGVDIRKQTMTTTTTRETVMRDVVNDGVWIGYQLYNLIAREVGFPQKVVPTDF